MLRGAAGRHAPHHAHALVTRTSYSQLQTGCSWQRLAACEMGAGMTEWHQLPQFLSPWGCATSVPRAKQ